MILHTDLKFKLYLMVLWSIDFIFEILIKKKVPVTLGWKISSTQPYLIGLELKSGDGDGCGCSKSESGGAKSDSNLIRCHS
jgi:hypothetical protein